MDLVKLLLVSINSTAEWIQISEPNISCLSIANDLIA